MTRALYRILLALHPPAFRREFAADMLWIFDEEGGAASLLADAGASLVRQWLVRSGVWIVAVACAGAALTLVGGVMFGEVVRRGLAPFQVASRAEFFLICALTCV